MDSHIPVLGKKYFFCITTLAKSEAVKTENARAIVITQCLTRHVSVIRVTDRICQNRLNTQPQNNVSGSNNWTGEGKKY